MITAESVCAVGRVVKTHGIHGEVVLATDSDLITDVVAPGTCLIFDIDGIFTPFFVKTTRPRGAESLLITFDGYKSQEEAAFFCGRDAYMDADKVPQVSGELDEDADGFYAAQLIGFTAIDGDNGNVIGKIIDIDDQTLNVLFVVERPDGDTALIPVADEFITEISVNEKKITFDLPEGLL